MRKQFNTKQGSLALPPVQRKPARAAPEMGATGNITYCYVIARRRQFRNNASLGTESTNHSGAT